MASILLPIPIFHPSTDRGKAETELGDEIRRVKERVGEKGSQGIEKRVDRREGGD